MLLQIYNIKLIRNCSLSPFVICLKWGILLGISWSGVELLTLFILSGLGPCTERSEVWRLVPCCWLICTKITPFGYRYDITSQKITTKFQAKIYCARRAFRLIKTHQRRSGRFLSRKDWRTETTLIIGVEYSQN
jgi:hypothetical protein